MKVPYQRKVINTLLERLSELPRFLIFIAGPRQVGKTTLVRQALSTTDPQSFNFIAIDQPVSPTAMFTDETTREEDGSPRNTKWLIKIWEDARKAARKSTERYILALDEIQKLSGWSEVVKGLWDADRAEGLNLHIILLGSSPLLMQKGMSESLAGRYELIKLTHWSFIEMVEAFNFDLTDYIYFGGYPGSASLIRDETRWRNFVRESLIRPSIEKDILLMTRVDKPALLKQLFELSCKYSGQLLSYNKMLGQLQDAGQSHTVTLAHYLDLLSGAGLVTGLQKYAGQAHRRRASSPKLNVLNTALMSLGSSYTKSEAMTDRSYWGRLVESTVGAHLYNTANSDCDVYYWRDDTNEVDFIITRGPKITLVEVKSGQTKAHVPGFEKFEKGFGQCRKIIVGDNGIPIIEFLSYPAEHWL
ncbi:MAG: ATP-binding protein [Gammaproteobacteria bacterium]|nr:ATP-binding protein [Gammaproteobacteria bacterium]